MPKSYREQAIERREKTRLANIERKREEILAEGQATFDLDSSSHQLTDKEEKEAMDLLGDAEQQDQPQQIDIKAEFAAIEQAEQQGDSGNILDITEVIQDNEEEVIETWRKLDGWKRYDHLRSLPERTQEQAAWMGYYETTSEYSVLIDMYNDMEANG